MGYWRFFLAVMVVLEHMAPNIFPRLGGIAVFSFYLLSGYLITGVVNRQYRDGIAGLRRFFINRFLRIYPAYYSILAVSALGIHLHPEIAGRLNQAMQFPSSAYGITAQITIYGLLWPDALARFDPASLYWIRLIPTAWSLNMELIFYVIIAVFLARTRRTALAWFLCSCLTFPFLLYAADPRTTYFTVLGPNICFSTGAALYFLKQDEVWSFVPDRMKSVFLPVFLTTTIISGTRLPELLLSEASLSVFTNTILLASVPLSALSLYSIMSKPAFPRHRYLQRMETLAADLSYPVFLAHWPIAVFVSAMLFNGETTKGLALLGPVLVATILFSWLVIVAVERPVQVLRGRVRSGAPVIPMMLPRSGGGVRDGSLR